MLIESDEFALRMPFLVGLSVGLPLFVIWYLRRDPLVRPLPSYSTLSLNVTRFQLDAIPTVGFSDPILSYFSALRFIFDGTRMLKKGYEKVTSRSLYPPVLDSV
jgi:hypothetical protein